MTTQKVIVSVIILTHNSKDTIKSCLGSLEKQTSSDFEVIVVDDSSTDNTLKMVRNTSLNPKIIIEPSNIPKARNIGIKNSIGKYIAFIDSDAYADKDWVSQIIKTFSNNKDLALIGGRELPVHYNNFSYALSLIDETIKSYTSSLWKIRTCNFAIRKSILNKTGYFDESWSYHEDTEFAQRIKKSPYKYAYEKDIKVSHIRRTNPNHFFKQQFRYAIWRIKLSIQKKEYRVIDYIPCGLVFTILLSIVFPLLFAFVISAILAESVFVLIHTKQKFRYLPYLFIGFFIKNIGWGLGIYYGLFSNLKNRQ